MSWFKLSHDERVRRHEDKLLGMQTFDFNIGRYPNYPKVSRFTKREDGSVYVFGGGYHIDGVLWSQWMQVLRHPDANHNFAWTKFANENRDPSGQSWPTTYAECTRCHEKREISMMIDLDRVNRGGWCVK